MTTASNPFLLVIGYSAVSATPAFTVFPLSSFFLLVSSVSVVLHLLVVSHFYPFITTDNMDDFDMLNAPSAGNGVGSEEDPAAAFLAQQESEIAGIENDEGFSILDSGDVPSSLGDTNGAWLLCSSEENVAVCCLFGVISDRGFCVCVTKRSTCG